MPLFVRSLTLSDRSAYGSEGAEPLIEVIRVIKNAKQVNIRGSYTVSQRLLDEISRVLPKAKITYDSNFPREEDGFYDGWGPSGPLDGGMNGFSSPQLHSFNMDHIWYYDCQGLPVVRRSLERIVKSCPNLRHLTAFGGNSNYGTHYGFNQELHLEFSPVDNLPSLESLCYIPLSHKTLQSWGEIKGWQSLRILRLGRASDLTVFNRFSLPNLHTLSINRGVENQDFCPGDLEVLPDFRAPIKFLRLEGLNEGKLPSKFLGHFANTLEELVIGNARKTSGFGYGSEDIRMLNTVCPALKRLWITPVIDKEGSNWPSNIITAVCELQFLEELIFSLPWIAKSDTQSRPESKNLKPSAALCEEAYSCIRGLNSTSLLKRFGVAQGLSFTWDYSFKYLIRNADFSCARVGSDLILGARQHEHFDNTFNKCRMESIPKTLALRPWTQTFSSPWNIQCQEKDIIWAANQLGPGPGWAEVELLPFGLIRKAHFGDPWKPFNGNIQIVVKKVVEDRESLHDYRQLVKEELVYWKKRWELEDLHGKYFSLYDIFYPETNRTGII